MSNTIDFKQLLDPFPSSDIEWRIGRASVTQNGVLAWGLAYVENRAIMSRLDIVCGPENWRNEFQSWHGNSQLCGLSIRVDGEWITKWDGADNTDIHSTKGGLSNAMKRAAVQWGIGRYLYNLPETKLTTQKYERGQRGPGKGWEYATAKTRVNNKEERVGYFWQVPSLPTEFLPAGDTSAVRTISDAEPLTSEPPSNGSAGNQSTATPEKDAGPEKVATPENWKGFVVPSGQFANQELGSLDIEILRKFHDHYETNPSNNPNTIELAKACAFGLEAIVSPNEEAIPY